MYNQDHYQFKNAEELWIWVDTSYVSFEEFALQVRYMDYTGTLLIDSGDCSVEKNWITHAYSKDVYSTCLLYTSVFYDFGTVKIYLAARQLDNRIFAFITSAENGVCLLYTSRCV